MIHLLTNKVRTAVATVGIGSAVALLPIAIGSAIVLLKTSAAEACRDCPFPLRIDEDRWLMPNGKMEVEIHESACDENGEVTVTVYLIHPDTREMLASGETKRKLTKDRILLMLYDRSGNLIKGDISWHGSNKSDLQAKFLCLAECSISSFND